MKSISTVEFLKVFTTNQHSDGCLNFFETETSRVHQTGKCNLGPILGAGKSNLSFGQNNTLTADCGLRLAT